MATRINAPQLLVKPRYGIFRVLNAVSQMTNLHRTFNYGIISGLESKEYR